MSGHNKFSQIKHQKASEDGKRSKLFSMLGRQIAIQSRLAGGDVNNPSLRTLLEKARKLNMPKDTIDRGVARGTGGNEATLEEVVFETFGSGGVAIIIQGITDSKNRTSQEIKHILSKNELALGTPGSAIWAFSTSRNEEGDIVYTPNSVMEISTEDKTKLESLIITLTDHDDIKNIATNSK